jgi:hypothetical protein
MPALFICKAVDSVATSTGVIVIPGQLDSTEYCQSVATKATVGNA